MKKKIICPQCGSEHFKCSATITATLETKTYEDGHQDYELSEWEDIESIDWFECQNCDFFFDGNEEELIDFLESEERESKAS